MLVHVSVSHGWLTAAALHRSYMAVTADNGVQTGGVVAEVYSTQPQLNNE